MKSEISALNIGLVGCGRWGRNILRDLLSLQCQVLVADPDPEARQQAEQMGCQFTASHHDELPEVDGLVIATPTTIHAEVINQCLPRKIPIFCEKPLAPDAKDCKGIAEQSGQQVFVMNKWAYHPGVQALAEIAHKKTLGKVQQLRTLRVQWGQPHDDVDGTWILAPHDLSIVDAILGGLPEPVCTAGDFTGDALDGITAILGHDPVAIIEVSSRQPMTRRLITLSCEQGVVQLTDPLADHLEIWRIGSGRQLASEAEKLPISTKMPLLNELEHFCHYLIGGPKPLCDARQGAQQVEILEKLRAMAGSR